MQEDSVRHPPSCSRPSGSRPSGSELSGSLRWTAAVIGLVMVAAACTGGPESSTTTELPASTVAPTTLSPRTLPSTTVPAVFDPHTTERIDSLADFEVLAVEGVGGQQIVKFTIADFRDAPTVEFLDGSFYELHDEWFWYLLLNGQAAPGSRVEPIDGLSFDSIDAIYEWASDLDPDELPLDLRLTEGGRMYSPQYYDGALDDPLRRTYGLGSIVRVPARIEEPTRGELWLISLEHADDAPPEQIERYFEVITSAVNPGLGDRLVWATRSPQQELVAERLAAAGGPWAERVMAYADLAVPGESVTYNAGIAVGRLRRVAQGASDVTDAESGDILLIEQAPDWLPPAAALVTASPQTPLAHVGILARNRGIPNGYLGGATEDPDLVQLASVHAAVAVRADAGGVTIVALTDEQYRDAQSVSLPQRVVVPAVDVAALPLVVDLATVVPDGESLTEARLAELRPIIGGKAAGLMALQAAEVATPEHITGITVRAYIEHLERVEPAIEALLTNADFSTSDRIRFLALEGGGDYELRYASDVDAEARAAFEAAHADDVIGEVLEAGGFKSYFRDVPVESSTLAAIEAALATTFADHSAEQGLRFRSSSSVEDIDGFSGAGLYDSNTGFLEPDRDSADKGRTRSVEWALLKTWASYWSAEAYEERELEGVDHRSGAMGVVVHARFDDDLEVSNGVFTFSVSPLSDDTFSMELNVQVGAESVTNPDVASGATPEVVSMIEEGGDLTIERRQRSNRTDDPVLGDEELAKIFAAAKSVTSQWLDRLDADLTPEQLRSTFTLDFEFRQMAAGWPALADGDPHPARIVFKQVRSLEPGVRHLSDEVLALPVARDLLARASLVERVTCPNDEFVRIWTRPLTVPDFGHSEEPLIVDLTGDGTPVAPPDEDEPEGCTFDTLYSSAEHLLLALFEDG